MSTLKSRAATQLASAALLLGFAQMGSAVDGMHDMHAHGMASGVVSGLPHGIPRLCAEPNVRTIRSGKWNDAAIWSTGKVPAQGDAVLITPATRVTYGLISDSSLRCLDIEGTLSFSTSSNTRLKVGTLTVLEQGTLEIGTAAAPVAPAMTAELVIADLPIDAQRDPEQFGTGLIGLGRVSMHGAIKAPTFVRASAEPTKDSRELQVEEVVSGWRVGDKLVLPDTRQLMTTESRSNYKPQWEALRVVAVSGHSITLSAALQFDHHGARDGDGKLSFLPHVGNVTRNVVVRSENPHGTRGHVIFAGHPDIDIRYALFEGLGRTQLGVLDNVQYGSDGHAVHVGDNQIGRYSLHFHHVFGPGKPQPDGYQFTVIGNAIDDASKWGITVHNSHYGLIRDNVVYDSRGAGIVTEDGTESFNVFAHNFAVRSQGSGQFAPSSGYSGAAPDPGGEGAGFWFRGPNNYIRDNVAANTEVFGFGLAAGELGEVRIPKFQGADTSQEGQYVLRDSTAMPVMEFTHNEAYGAIQTGVAVGWNCILADARIWHTTLAAVTGMLADSLTVDHLTVRGDPAVLSHEFENPAGVWFGDYTSKTLLVRNSDVQGMRVGIESPFFMNTHPEPGRGNGEAQVQDSYFRDYVGVSIGTAYVDPARPADPVKRASVANTRFDALNVAPLSSYAPAAISMNYGTSAGDRKLRVPVAVHGYNTHASDDFQVYYSNDIPAAPGQCAGGAKAGIDGFACVAEGGKKAL